MTSISGVSTSLLSNQSSSITGLGQSLNALQSAVQSGNLSTAQTAFSSLLNYFPDVSQSSNSSSGAKSGNSIASDLQTIQTAIQTGNVGAAQSAVTKLTTDLHSTKGQGGRYQHHSGTSLYSDLTNGSSQTSSTSSTPAGTSTSTSNPLLDLLNGDSSGADGTTVNYLA